MEGASVEHPLVWNQEGYLATGHLSPHLALANPSSSSTSYLQASGNLRESDMKGREAASLLQAWSGMSLLKVT